MAANGEQRYGIMTQILSQVYSRIINLAHNDLLALCGSIVNYVRDSYNTRFFTYTVVNNVRTSYCMLHSLPRFVI
jgi:hypothetical protein